MEGNSLGTTTKETNDKFRKEELSRSLGEATLLKSTPPPKLTTTKTPDNNDGEGQKRLPSKKKDLGTEMKAEDEEMTDANTKEDITRKLNPRENDSLDGALCMKR